MAQHKVTYTEISGPTGDPVYIKTHCHICGPLGTFQTEAEADYHARKHIN